MVNAPTGDAGRDRLDEEIRQRLLARDPDGLAMLLREYGDRVRRRLSFDFPTFGPDEIDDAIQRGLGKVWKHIGRFDPQKAPLLAWFGVICRRLAVDVLAERAKSGGEQIEEWSNLAAEGERTTNPLAEVVREVIESLAPLQRLVIESDLADPSGVAPADRIAAEAGTTAGAVYNARQKAKRAIEKRLRRRGIDGDSLLRRAVPPSHGGSGHMAAEDEST